MKNVALHNLGCKVNGYELDVMQQRLESHGYHVVSFDSKADVYIINTCTVTNIADRKSRQMLHKAKKENPEAVVVAVGCYVETDPNGVKKDESIDLAVGNNKKGDIVEILDAFFQAKEHGDNPDQTLDGRASDDINHEREYASLSLEHQPEHTRAYIKIQDGCDQFCSYCIIPYARGRIRSRDEENILNEIRRLAVEGTKEVVLTGIHISSYGVDRAGTETKLSYNQNFEIGARALLSLIQKVAEIDGIERIRLGSLEPRIITEETAQALAKIPKLCPHFHLSLQSGCDATLERMNRHYTSEEFARGVELLRGVYDRPAITTDVIVGFPGETEGEFAASRDFVSAINFYEMHVFKYSIRHGTVAASMKDQLTDKEKSIRSDALLQMTKQQSGDYRRSFLGEEVNVLWEEQETMDGQLYWTGHTERYVKVAKKADHEILAGTITRERIGNFLGEELLLAYNE